MVLEDELDEGQSFNNGYERSKYEAERYLAVFLGQYRVPCTIYRPGIITGMRLRGIPGSARICMCFAGS